MIPIVSPPIYSGIECSELNQDHVIPLCSWLGNENAFDVASPPRILQDHTTAARKRNKDGGRTEKDYGDRWEN